MINSFTQGWISYHPIDRHWTLSIPQETPLWPFTEETKTVKIGKWKKEFRLHHGEPDKELISTKVLFRKTRDEIEIGPLIGILTVEGKKNFKGIRSNFIDLIEMGKIIGAFVYVVPIENINWKKHSVTGFLYYPQKKKWLKEILPFPHVFYNRIPSRKAEDQEHVQQVLTQLNSLKKTSLFNPCFFDKASLYESLRYHPHLISHLPETCLFQSYLDIQIMVDKYPFIYLKPLKGMAGKGIYRLEKRDQSYLLKLQQGQSLVQHQCNDQVELFSFLQEKCQVPYLIQQGIPLACYEDKVFDFRLLMQKNGLGRWELTGIGIRQSGEGNITTHVPRGGSVQSPSKLLPLVFPQLSVQNILQKLERIALTVSEILENKWPSLGEISMDIGLDDKGHLWFFEANSKPGKFDEPDIRKRSLENLIQYAGFCSGFTKENLARAKYLRR